MIGAGMLVRSISYENSPVPKHLAWMLHAGDCLLMGTADTHAKIQRVTITLMFETGVLNAVFHLFLITRCDGCCHRPSHSPGRTSDAQGCLVHGRHRRRAVYRGYVCPQWEVPQHGWALGGRIWSGLRIFPWWGFWEIQRDPDFARSPFPYGEYFHWFQDPCSCHPRLHLELACIQWLFMEAWSCSACSCSMTHRRS